MSSRRVNFALAANGFGRAGRDRDGNGQPHGGTTRQHVRLLGQFEMGKREIRTFRLLRPAIPTRELVTGSQKLGVRHGIALTSRSTTIANISDADPAGD